LQEQSCQIRYDSCHWRGWADHYALKLSEQIIGYGAIKGLEDLEDRDTIFEIFILPHFRSLSLKCMLALVDSCGAQYMEAQTNDRLTTALVYHFCHEITSDVILFEDSVQTVFPGRGTIFRRRLPTDFVFGKQEDIDEYVLLLEDEVIAAGGFLRHYNEPFADLYMEVDQSYRRQGFATLMLQEIKKACYQAGRRPVARCNLSNRESKATLFKAGFEIVGCMVKGIIRCRHEIS